MLRYETGILAGWLNILLAIPDLKSPAQIGSEDVSVTHFIAVLKPGKNLEEMKGKGNNAKSRPPLFLISSIVASASPAVNTGGDVMNTQSK